jgi:hypothetical protein
MPDETLQFDRAEYEQPAGPASCAQCQQQLSGSYYQINGVAVCPTCAEVLRAQWTGGSSAGRFIRASVAGAGAALLGALVYYGVGALTGYEFGLIAIVVGFAVGAAVRWGSNRRGGWVYQTLAIALTYIAIVSTYVPAIVAGIRNSQAQDAAQSDQNTPGPKPVAQTDTAAAQPPTLRDFVVAILLLTAIACAAPFLAGIQNIMGLIIIAIGLYEAWKLNRRTGFEMTGPHTVGTATVA